MLVLGFLFLMAFVLWEWKVASSPIMPERILRNRAFIGAVTIDVFYFASGNLRATYLSSFVWITKNFSTRDYALFNNSESPSFRSLLTYLRLLVDSSLVPALTVPSACASSD